MWHSEALTPNTEILSSNTNIDGICSKLNNFLPVVQLFTIWTKEVKTQLVIGNQHIPSVTLGVRFDNMLMFCAHGKSVQNKMQASTNILKSLAGSSWDKEKKLTITYKAIGRSILNYAAPNWSPQLSTSSCNDIQRAQNAALRTITVCHVMSNQNHLHRKQTSLQLKSIMPCYWSSTP